MDDNPNLKGVLDVALQCLGLGAFSKFLNEVKSVGELEGLIFYIFQFRPQNVPVQSKKQLLDASDHLQDVKFEMGGVEEGGTGLIFEPE